MSTIRKQSIYSSLFTYAGFAIGAFNILYLYPTFFTPEQFGLTRIIGDIALIFSTICTAGVLPITFKFSPYYQQHVPKEKNDLMALVLLFIVFTCSILYLLFPYIQPWAIRKFGRKSPDLVNYFYLVYPITVSIVLFSILESFTWIIKKTIISNFAKEFLQRLLITILIALWAFGMITQFEVFVSLYAYLFFASSIVLIVIIYRSKVFAIHLKPSSLTKKLGPIMLRFGSAYFLSAILNVIAKTNDTLIIASQSSGGLVDAAIFTIATYMITIMDVPQRSMISAATPQIALAWKDNDIAKLDRLYKKTALNLLIIASGIMGVIIINTPLLLHLLGPTYKLLPTLMLVMGVSKLIDLGTGLNSQILQLSKHWKIDLFTNMFFVVVSIILNYYLTRTYGIIGTAFGGLIAIVCFNLIRFIYIKNIYALQPFSWKNAIAISIATLFTAVIFFIPLFHHVWIDSILKSIAFILLFGISILKMNISQDITDLYRALIQKMLTIRSRD